MAQSDYFSRWCKDLPVQFRGKPRITALIRALTNELQEVKDALQSLESRLNIDESSGTQLDRIGTIVGLTRSAAGEYFPGYTKGDVVSDELYRIGLKFKMYENTSDCTYASARDALRLFWAGPLHYEERADQPATMIWDTGEMEGLVDTSPLFVCPFIRAAGVKVVLYARTSTRIEAPPIRIFTCVGYPETESELPEIELDYQFLHTVGIASCWATDAKSGLPEYEPDYAYQSRLRGVTALGGTESSSGVDVLDRDIEYDAGVDTAGYTHGSLMITPIPEI